MTRQTKTSQAFRQAKKRLLPIGDCHFICWALAGAAYDRSVMAADFDWHAIHKTQKSGFKTAIKTITDRIGSECTLETWLGSQGISIWFMDDRHEQMQAYRHRWIDALIAEFESKGD
jgi:hypothetical protein